MLKYNSGIRLQRLKKFTIITIFYTSPEGRNLYPHNKYTEHYRRTNMIDTAYGACFVWMVKLIEMKKFWKYFS